MKQAILLALVAVAGYALALDYPTALSLADQRTTVVSARLRLANASASLERTEADPLALRIDRLRARQDRDLAATELRLSRIKACSEISSAYSHVLDAEAQVELAKEGLALATKGLKIARLRLEKGGASEQEVIAAEISLREAQNRLRAAENGAVLARSQLVSLIGVEAGSDALQTTPELETPPWEVLIGSLERHPDWLRAHQAAVLAAAAYDLLDPSYAAPAQIDEARTNKERAQKGADEAERGLKLRAEQRWNDVADKRQAMELAGEKLQKASDDLKIAQKRFQAGLISELALQQAELQEHRARLEHSVARHALLASQWALFEAVAWLPAEVCDER